MTSVELFEFLSNNPVLLVFYFIAVPMTAFLAGLLDRNQGHRSPWKYLYSVLVFLGCIPGILAFIINFHFFIFEQQGFGEGNIYVQILPIASMLATLWLIRLVVNFEVLPWFRSIWSLLLVTFLTFLIVWLIVQTDMLNLLSMSIEWATLFFLFLMGALLWIWSTISG